MSVRIEPLFSLPPPSTCRPPDAAVIGSASQHAVNFGVLGGKLCGLPVFVSSAAPQDSSGGLLALVDMAAVQIAGGDTAELSTTTAGVIEQSDAPTGNTITTATASAT
jgi:hypothetical protein